MTVREMIKKVEAHNKLSEELGLESRAALYFNCGLHSERIYGWKDFKDYINTEWIDVLAKVFLECKDYGFNEVTDITAVDAWGYKFNEQIEFWVEEV